jgi:hypothetical protein
MNTTDAIRRQRWRLLHNFVRLLEPAMVALGIAWLILLAPYFVDRDADQGDGAVAGQRAIEIASSRHRRVACRDRTLRRHPRPLKAAMAAGRLLEDNVAMRLTAAVALVVACRAGVSAQGQPPTAPVSVEAIHKALQRSPQQPLIFRDVVPPPEFRPRHLGALTLVAPATRSEIVNVSIPVGDLTMRAARAFSNAQHRRAERAAQRRVLDDVRAFQRRQQRP